MPESNGSLHANPDAQLVLRNDQLTRPFLIYVDFGEQSVHDHRPPVPNALYGLRHVDIARSDRVGLVQWKPRDLLAVHRHAPGLLQIPVPKPQRVLCLVWLAVKRKHELGPSAFAGNSAHSQSGPDRRWCILALTTRSAAGAEDATAIRIGKRMSIRSGR